MYRQQKTHCSICLNRGGTSQEVTENGWKAATNGYAHGVPFIVKLLIWVHSQQGAFTVYCSVCTTVSVQCAAE